MHLFDEINYERWLWRCLGHSFVSKFLKELWIFTILIFCFWIPSPQNIINLFLFFHQFPPICSYKFSSFVFRLKRVYKHKNGWTKWKGDQKTIESWIFWKSLILKRFCNLCTFSYYFYKNYGILHNNTFLLLY